MPNIPRSVRTIATVVSASAVALLLVATPAQATANTSLHVDVLGGISSMSVCVSGTASVSGDFQLSIDGVRSNTSRISDSASGLNRLTWTPPCRPVDKSGTSYGSFVVTFTFRSGTVSADDSAADGEGAWAVGFNDLTIGSGG